MTIATKDADAIAALRIAREYVASVAGWTLHHQTTQGRYERILQARKDLRTIDSLLAEIHEAART